MKRRGRRQVQPRLKGVSRVLVSGCVNPEIEARIERDATRLNCSKSWIRHAHSAEFYGITIPTPPGMRLR